MKNYIWSMVSVCLLLLRTAAAQGGNVFTVSQAVINYPSLYNGTDLSQNIILIGSDYLDAFYSKLCDKDTSYYKLSFLDNGLYFASETGSFLKKKIDSSKYSEMYQCEGHYLTFNCTRMLQTSQCGSGNVVLQAKYDATGGDYCNKSSIPLCLPQRQRMTIAINMTQPVPQIEVTTVARVVRTQSLNKTSRNAGARNGPIENTMSMSLLIISATLLLMSLASIADL